MRRELGRWTLSFTRPPSAGNHSHRGLWRGRGLEGWGGAILEHMVRRATVGTPEHRRRVATEVMREHRDLRRQVREKHGMRIQLPKEVSPG